ncbi:hypothetical protein LZ32DRAFT_48171 [Colletotrichum eremochloae]|nr:hypothetical protein LZ32DRAFT_48171 [Colletotrichum eremochloae]
MANRCVTNKATEPGASVVVNHDMIEVDKRPRAASGRSGRRAGQGSQRRSEREQGLRCRVCGWRCWVRVAILVGLRQDEVLTAAKVAGGTCFVLGDGAYLLIVDSASEAAVCWLCVSKCDSWPDAGSSGSRAEVHGAVQCSGMQRRPMVIVMVRMKAIVGDEAVAVAVGRCGGSH